MFPLNNLDFVTFYFKLPLLSFDFLVKNLNEFLFSGVEQDRAGELHRGIAQHRLPCPGAGCQEGATATTEGSNSIDQSLSSWVVVKRSWTKINVEMKKWSRWFRSNKMAVNNKQKQNLSSSILREKKKLTWTVNPYLIFYNNDLPHDPNLVSSLDLIHFNPPDPSSHSGEMRERGINEERERRVKRIEQGCGSGSALNFPS